MNVGISENNFVFMFETIEFKIILGYKNAKIFNKWLFTIHSGSFTTYTYNIQIYTSMSTGLVNPFSEPLENKLLTWYLLDQDTLMFMSL